MRLVFVFLLSLSIVSATAQDYWKIVGRKVPAYIITRKGELVQGRIRVQNKYDAQHQLYFFDVDNKKSRFVPFEIKEYGFFSPKEDSIKFVQVQHQGEYVWAEQRKNDYLKLYIFYYPILTDTENQMQNNSSNLNSRWLIQKGNLPVVSFDYGRFYEQATEYFQDYMELSDDIWNRKYKRSQLPEIVDTYNQWKRNRK